MDNKKNLVFKYSLQQAFYWSAYCGIFTFAVTYLLGKGFDSSTIGMILFSANFLSFMIQPVVASKTDRASGNIIPKLMSGLTVCSGLCFLAILLIQDIPLLLLSVLYVAGCTLYDMNQAFLNAENVYYSQRNWETGYGLGRGIGSITFSVVSLGLGRLMNTYGVNGMPAVSLFLMILFFVSCLIMPNDESLASGENSVQESVSLIVFFKKYKWYVVSLFGVLLLAMVHLMLESYLINIVTRLGGNSSNVGTALFVATIFGTFSFIFTAQIHKKLGSRRMLAIAGFFYIVKVCLFISAKSLIVIFITQVLQTVTYAFLSPTQMYYSGECTQSSDMVKGQAMSSAFYAMGGALGNLMGGLLIGSFGLNVMLFTALAIAVMGFAVLFVSVPKALLKKPGFAETV